MQFLLNYTVSKYQTKKIGKEVQRMNKQIQGSASCPGSILHQLSGSQCAARTLTKQLPSPEFVGTTGASHQDQTQGYSPENGCSSTPHVLTIIYYYCYIMSEVMFRM